ncbi:OapA family protein [Oceanospirillum sediminis]|uniref:Peptidoglycan DD-metalloendopeptidase family protein n=1 Tax=Oceanospirillum sediminis TaxID=2760088 RepID=A0A839ITS4_9GAMM|nr:peptidoglycan DD-metalloendopeptidase family protein [Oceanospirillum sediminis]MBB1488062.1 peptidoglycan DD-metalloendopeptidase family protein [Oceanospirillum sediminis]
MPLKVSKMKHHLALGTIISIGLITALISSQDVSAKRIDVPLDLQVKTTPQKKDAEPSADSSDWPELDEQWQTYTVKRGETLSQLFSRADLRTNDLYSLINSPELDTDLARLKPGQQLHFQLDDEQKLQMVRLDHSKTRLSMFERQDSGSFSENILTRDTTKELTYSEGQIKDSFFNAGKDAELSHQTVMSLASVFGWDIDFSLDMRPGDTFKVLYYQEHLDGQYYRDGDILAAEFTNQGRTYRAIRYTDQNGNTDYYSEDGRSMKKQFLRSPMDFTRISSHFTTRRYHPVLHKFRSHKGTDYAAKRGTPIKATGTGKVIRASTSRGYGKHVILQHGQRYTTLYAHMNAFGKGIRKGTKVRQGQVIGYVGSTGLATGPHLHYEFRVNGIHKNPVTVKLPDADPIAKKERERFDQYASNLLSSFESYSQTQVAKLDTSE